MSQHHNSISSEQQLSGEDLSGASRIESIGFWLMFFYFAAKVSFFAVTIKERVFPDESSWFGFIRVFSQFALLPVDSPESYPFGIITHIPWLYFFLMGKIVACNVFPVSDLIFLRLVNGAISLTTVFFGWRLAKALRLSLPVRCLFIVMLTNTVMFTFVSAAVSYDILSTLFAVLALYCLVRFFQERLAVHGLLCCLFALAGMLTKNVMLPYCLALLLAFLAKEGKRWREWVKEPLSFIRSLRGCNAMLAVLCLGGFAANVALYGGNLIRFDSLLPTMDQVLPVEACLQNRLFARDYVVREFQAGRLSMLEAQRIALQIRDPGDRASAWSRLAEAASSVQKGPSPRMSRWRYTLEWIEVVVSRTYSVAAHLSLFKFARDFYPYYAVFSAAGVLWCLRFRGLMTLGMGSVIFVTIFYSVVLMQGVNYTIYRGSGFSGVALTGRYMFPVLAPVYLLTAQGLIGKTHRWWQAVVSVSVSLLFVLGEFPWFVRNAGPEWYF